MMFHLLVVIACLMTALLSSVCSYEVDDVVESLMYRHNVVRTKLSSRLFKDMESESGMELEGMNVFRKEGFVEVRVYDPFGLDADAGQIQCQIGHHETRYTMVLGRCMPNMGLFDDSVRSIKVVANDQAIRIGVFGDHDCQDFTARYIWDIQEPCLGGITMAIVDKRTPHAMGLSVRSYIDQTCNGPHNDVFWADGTCWNQSAADGGGSAEAFCGGNTIFLYSLERCDFTGYSTSFLMSNIPEFFNCAKNKKQSTKIVCGGNNP